MPIYIMSFDYHKKIIKYEEAPLKEEEKKKTWTGIQMLIVSNPNQQG